jgi:adenosine/AMP kinase
VCSIEDSSQGKRTVACSCPPGFVSAGADACDKGSAVCSIKHTLTLCQFLMHAFFPQLLLSHSAASMMTALTLRSAIKEVVRKPADFKFVALMHNAYPAVTLQNVNVYLACMEIQLLLASQVRIMQR